MKWCDDNISIVEWGSETIIIPYISPIDNKIHRYFVDFYVKIKNKNNLIEKYLIEIIHE
jgi:trans-aconitate methyltransferase